MTGVLTPFGELTVGACLPTTVAAFGAVEGDLNGQLAVAGGLSVSLAVGPPSIDVGVDASAQIMAAVAMPSIDLGIDANLSAIAAINAQLSLLAGLVAALGTAGIFLHVYDGTADSFGGAVGSAFGSGLPGGSPSDHIQSVVLTASTPAAWEALAKFIKTS